MRRKLRHYSCWAFLAFMFGALAGQAAMPFAEMDGAQARHAALVAEAERRSVEAMEPLADGALETTEIELVDFRIALVQLAQVAGANDQLTVVRAQPPGARVLSIQGGTVDLPRLLAVAEALAPGSVTENGLALPVIVQPRATLDLADGILILERTNGAFLAVLGRLRIDGGGVVAKGPENPRADSFSPFVLTAGTGVMTAHDALFDGLGFGKVPAFSGVSVLTAGLYRPEAPSILSGSVLRDVVSASFVGAEAPVIRDTQFLRTRRSSLVLRGTKHATVADNVFLDVQGGDAIRLSDRAIGTALSGLDILSVGGIGIRIEGQSHGTSLTDIQVWRATRSAITVEQSDCVTIDGLMALGSGLNGVILRQSRSSTLSDAVIAGSGRAALFIADQPPETDTVLSDLAFKGNRIGVATAAPSRLSLTRVDFSEQFPRFLDGDVERQTQAVIANLTGANPLELVAGSAAPRFLAPLDCPTPGGE